MKPTYLSLNVLLSKSRRSNAPPKVLPGPRVSRMGKDCSKNEMQKLWVK